MRFFAPALVVRGLAAAVLIVSAACSTPATRIKRNQEVFDALPPADQALIREGKVGVGFTPDMVKLAVGDPDQRWIRTDAEGRTEVWSYTAYDGPGGSPLYRGYYHRMYDAYPFYYDNDLREAARAREYFRVVFRAGRVDLVEQNAR